MYLSVSICNPIPGEPVGGTQLPGVTSAQRNSSVAGRSENQTHGIRSLNTWKYLEIPGNIMIIFIKRY